MIRRSLLVVMAMLAVAQSAALAAGSAPGFGVELPQARQDDGRSDPPDRTAYLRPRLPGELLPLGQRALPAGMVGFEDGIGAFLRDPVVSNTNANLTNTDTGNDGEPSIAVNPSNPNEIIIASFSMNAGFWHSLDGGNTWTFQASYPAPPGESVPCDQQPEFTRNNILAVTFLTCTNGNIATATTNNPANQASWNWPTDAGGNLVVTNTQGINNADQPWLVTAPQPANLAQDNIVVAYDDFSASPLGMQVTVAPAANPPTFANDTTVGTSALCCSTNPGLRLAADRRTGFVYALWQQTTGPNGDNSVNATIRLNRSTDGGQTWGLNGSATGIDVATGASNQRTPKFGTANALIGGVHHAAVDPVNGDIFVAYACGDGAGGDNPLCMVRMQGDGAGGVTVGTPTTITTLHSALPSVAVASNGVIGVLYTAFVGFSADSFPVYEAHLAISEDHGQTFTDRVLERFLSSATDNGNNRQRVLGDYQELVANGRTFYGTFTGNGVPFGRPFSNHDPIFFKASAGGPTIAVSGDLSFGKVARGTSVTRDVTVQNIGTEPLVVNGVSFAGGSDSAFSVVPNPGPPANIQPGGSVVYQVRYAPPGNSGPGSRTGTLQVQSNDPDSPTTSLQASGEVGVPKIAVSADLDFGTVARGTTVSRDLVVQNLGEAPLTITGVTMELGSDPAFSINPQPGTPQTLPPGSSVIYKVRFSPPANSGPGTRLGTVRVASDDPVTPNVLVPASGQVGVPKAGLSSSELRFGDVPVDDRTAPHTSQRTLIVANQASCDGCDLFVTGLSITGPNAPEFTIVGAPTLPAKIGAGNHLDLVVQLDPEMPGDRTATLTVTTDDPSTPSMDVALSGKGIIPAIGAAPEMLTFGPTVFSPMCADLCGTTQTTTIANTGQAELIVDQVQFSGSPAFSGPGAATPPNREAPNDAFVEPVTFKPTAAPSRKVTGELTVRDTFPFDGPLTVERTVPLCGESVGRGIRVLAVDVNGNPISTVGRVTLQSYGVHPKTHVDERSLSLVTIDPPESCQRLQFQYENQSLPATANTGLKQSYYTLKVVVGNKSTTETFTLGVDEFKVMRVTVVV